MINLHPRKESDDNQALALAANDRFESRFLEPGKVIRYWQWAVLVNNWTGALFEAGHWGDCWIFSVILQMNPPLRLAAVG